MYVLPILVGARMFHTYSGIVRYSSFIDLLHIAYANIVSLIVAYAWHHFVWSIPTTVFYHLHFRHIVLMYIIGTALMWSTRLLVKSLYEVLTTDANTLRTFIYGVKEGGVGLAKNISSLPTRQFVVKGFISPEEVSSNVRLMGERIYNIDDRLETAIRKARIKAVLVPSLMIDSFRNNIELQDLLLTAGVKIYMARQAQEMDSGREDGAEGHGFSLREVSVEDLLPRDQIHVDMKSVQQLLSGRRVLITGCLAPSVRNWCDRLLCANPRTCCW